MQWRKSSTSKQLLALLRSVLEDVPAQVSGPAIHDPPSPAWQHQHHPLHVSVHPVGCAVARHARVGAAAGRPAEPLDCSGMEHDPVARSRAQHRLEEDVHESIQAVLTLLSPDRTVDFAALLPLPAVATVLLQLFSDFLPGDLAAGNAHKWELLPLMRATACVCTQPDGYMLRLLHRPVLIAWPHLMSALRQQQKSRAQTPQLPGPAEGVHAELKVTGLL